MPYTAPPSRTLVAPTRMSPGASYNILDLSAIRSPGDLAFALSTCAIAYAKNAYPDGISYAERSHIVGIIESTKLELWRRLLTTYEDLAIEKNGDLPYLREKEISR